MSKSVNIKHTEILSEDHFVLKKITYDLRTRNGEWKTYSREAYDRGDAAAILLYCKATRSVILTRQFRLPAYIHGSDSGMLLEACAGMLDSDDPEAAIIRETEEETGYRITHVQKLFDAYMSPGANTEIIHFFTGEYDPSMKVGEGGGLASEQEDIEVLELPFEKAFNMISSGEIRDAKTIILLQHAWRELFVDP